MNRWIRFALICLMSVIALSAFVLLVGLLVVAAVLLVMVLLSAVLLAPEQTQNAWRALSAKVDGWFDRLEVLWTQMKTWVDAIGEREMVAQKAKEAAKERENAVPTTHSASDASASRAAPSPTTNPTDTQEG